MIPIKIQCACGQKYAFDVEPVGGHMPSSVACPACGADGSNEAEAIVVQSLASRPVVAATGGPVRVGAPTVATAIAAAAASPNGPVRIGGANPRATSAEPSSQIAVASAPAPATSRPMAKLPGQMDRAQAEHEARAKILWGDAPDQVVKFLKMQGVPAEDASSIVNELFLERAATIRSNGIKKIIIGSSLMCVPVGAFIGFRSMGILPIKLFSFTVMVGFYGGWTLLSGLFMFFSPKSEAGDVAEQ